MHVKKLCKEDALITLPGHQEFEPVHLNWIRDKSIYMLNLNQS